VANSAPGPGWYRDLEGRLCWWDGQAWGPAAPEQSEEDSGRTTAVLSHLGVLVGGFPLPLIMRQAEGPRNRFVRHHASEALNFQLTFLIVWLAGFVAVALIGAMHAGRPRSGRGLPAGALGVFALLWVLIIANLALSIRGCIRASRGEWWRYPVSIRFVRGARPKGPAGGRPVPTASPLA